MATSKSDSQLNFIPWLLNEIRSKHHVGLEWVDASQQILCIPWPRAKDDMPLGELGVIYCWHKYRKGLSYDQNRSPSTMKGTFRAIINSRDELTKVFGGNGVIHLKLNCYTADSLVALTPVDSPISSWLDEQYHVHSPTNDVMSRHGEVPSRHGDVTKSHGDVTSSLGVFASRHGDIKHTSGLSAPVKTGSPSSWEYPAIGPSFATDNSNNDRICSYELSTAPSWTQQLLLNEQNASASCNVNITVYSRGRVLCEKKTDLRTGFLIYSDTSEVDFNSMSDNECDKMYGKRSKLAEKLLICEIQNVADHDFEDALQNFNCGILLSSDSYFNVLAQRKSRARTYVGHSNQGGARQMKRSEPSSIFSYISFLEMAGNLFSLRHNKRAVNTSDLPTATTIISVGQEWTLKRSIHELPLYIEIRHERAETFEQVNLQSGYLSSGCASSGIVISVSDSVDTRDHLRAIELPLELMNAMDEEMDDDDFQELHDIVVSNLGI